MIRAMKGEPERDFLIPSDIRYETVGKTTGCPAGSGQNQDMFDDMGVPQPVADPAGTIQVALKKNQTPCRGD